jgi:hypothetical protein
MMANWREVTEELQCIITSDPMLHDAWRTEGMAGVVRLQAKRLDEVRDIAGKAWDFILEGGFHDQAMENVGELDSPERELSVKWEALRYAVETRDSTWLTEAEKRMNETIPKPKCAFCGDEMPRRSGANKVAVIGRPAVWFCSKEECKDRGWAAAMGCGGRGS